MFVRAQVGLVDLLREEYGIVPAGMLGHSAGEIACGYADGALTREQTVRLIRLPSPLLPWRLGARPGGGACALRLLPRALLLAWSAGRCCTACFACFACSCPSR